MEEKTRNRIVFNVETSRILEILSEEIYDSPLALIRENLQNAYDATLMRSTYESIDLNNLSITIDVEPRQLTIVDQGIGMSEEELRKNFWSAGASGKKTELAKQSGVIGTFGIGAMANFGVCTQLRVETRPIGSNSTFISVAERANLSIAEECIDLEHLSDDRPPGTTIIAYLDSSNQMEIENVRSYIEPYIEFLPVPVYLNGELISQRSFEESVLEQSRAYELISSRDVSHGLYGGTLNTYINSAGNVLARIGELYLDEVAVDGEIFIKQNSDRLMGLRNFFGLALIPIGGHYRFGGIVNLSILYPTAGREALSRTSIEHVNTLIRMVEDEITLDIAKLSAADRNPAFMYHLLSNNQIELADNVTVQVLPVDESTQLSNVKDKCHGKDIHYYIGRDKSIQQTFATSQLCLLNVSQNNPRRKIQLRYIRDILRIPEVPDRATVLEEYEATQLTMAEAALLIKMVRVLSDDYLLPNIDVGFAQISHGVSILVNKQDEIVQIRIARESGEVLPILRCYETAYEVFGDFVKDFVRSHLYKRIETYVPSSTKEGADALYELLMQKRELYRYRESELGDLEPLLSDLLGGDLSFGEVLKKVSSTMRPQSQRVSSSQIGSVENEIPDVVHSPLGTSEPNEFEATPAIMRMEISSPMKILTVGSGYKQLNNFQLFLGLSDRLLNREGDFFLKPHTTKVIWAIHRVIYIFADATDRLTLYYDIELKEPLREKSASGIMLPTTTLLTRNRIYVPVPHELDTAFRIVEGVKEFYVRYDIISRK